MNLQKAILLLSGIALLAIGCSKKEAVATDAESAASTQAEKLVVYMNDFDAIIGDMFKAATGYEIEVVSGNGAQTMSRIAAEGDNPLWDVVWIDSMPSVYTLSTEGRLVTDWTPENANLLTDFAKGVVPANKSFYPTGAHAAAVLVYNNEVYTDATAPKYFDDLTDASKGYKIAMADPSVAAPAYPLAAWFMQEKTIEGGQEYFTKLFDNGLKVYPKNPQIVQAFSGGEVDVALLQESNAYQMIDSGEPLTIVWPEGGAPASVRVAAISAKTNKMDVAKAFVNFLLDPKVQQQLVDTGDEGYFEPSVTGANMNDRRASDNATLGYADAEWAAEKEAEIKSWFADMSVQ